MEKIVHNRINTYLNNNDILNKYQNGFRAEHSTQDTVAKFTDYIAININNSKCTLATFIDFRKAFDTVNHKILLKKINSLGIKNNTLLWLTSYLYNRKQIVNANGVISKSGTITCGFPQGSTLGPLLFLIYINDINKEFIHAKIKLFADDTVLYTTSLLPETAREQFQHDLNSLNSWCNKHKLSINTSKTKSVLFGTKRFNDNITCANLQIAGDDIDFVNDYKYLGIILEKTLSFTKHIKYIHSLAAHKIYMLSKIRSCIDQNTATRIYKTKILPYVTRFGIVSRMSHELNI